MQFWSYAKSIICMDCNARCRLNWFFVETPLTKVYSTCPKSKCKRLIRRRACGTSWPSWLAFRSSSKTWDFSCKRLKHLSSERSQKKILSMSAMSKSLILSIRQLSQLSIPHSKKILLDVFGCIRNPHLIFFLGGRIGMDQVEASSVIVVGNTKDWKGKWL